MKNGCNVAGVASGLIGSVQGMSGGCLCARCVSMTELHGTSFLSGHTLSSIFFFI